MALSVGNYSFNPASWFGNRTNDVLPSAPNSKATQISKVAAQKIIDPLDHLISINGHGRASNKTFELPENVYLIIPHLKGLEQSYTLISPPYGLTFEELIYENQDGRIPAATSGGWKVYFPKEIVKDINISPWSQSDDPQIEYKSWVHHVPSVDIKGVKSKAGKVPIFATVPARTSNKDRLQYHGKEKFKVKVFAKTRLSKIIEELKKKQPEGPLVVIPFTCNSDPTKNNQNISYDLTKTLDVKALFKTS